MLEQGPRDFISLKIEDILTETGVQGLAVAAHTATTGTAVLAYDWSHGFLKFMTFNTTSFFSSLCVVLLLLSGFRLENKLMMWILTIAMTSALTFTGLTYIWAQSLVTPDHIVDKVNRMGLPLSIVWVIILLLVGLSHLVHLVMWIKKWKKQLLHTSKHLPPRIGPLGQNYPI
ncbi:uncharacterized protein LOC113870741 [Abrus precatorius]|uniref:Uncharacterized protein LOC113870741 n=1 Tax=Abrus precatorius TaxID=3816 RepID=A0A8B8M7A6_ABRPR|nr:uncharacterized protein LOC113870741 [Abrus precatorius]